MDDNAVFIGVEVTKEDIKEVGKGLVVIPRSIYEFDDLVLLSHPLKAAFNDPNPYVYHLGRTGVPIEDMAAAFCSPDHVGIMEEVPEVDKDATLRGGATLN
jgi:hypothetical protein